jgi:shikimate dehydrogenase
VIPVQDELEGESFDLVVNATSLGLAPDDPVPLELNVLARVGAAMDLVYGPTTTPFLRMAEDLGIRGVDGGEMLVQQGAASFERWWGRSAPVEAMRSALEKARSGR